MGFSPMLSLDSDSDSRTLASNLLNSINFILLCILDCYIISTLAVAYWTDYLGYSSFDRRSPIFSFARKIRETDLVLDTSCGSIFTLYVEL